MDAEGLVASPHLVHAHTSCGQCNRWQGRHTRNLVVCIDGTCNEFGQNRTNVVKLFSKINVKTPSPKQYAYYIGGIGTDPKPSCTLNRWARSAFDKFDIALGWSVDKIIKEAYCWLAERYQAGDRIYLFGFSRGAYQARVLAAMIHEVGLTTTSMQKQVNRAYDRYTAIHSGKPEARDTARRFKALFSWDCLLRVHFVGVWDTVSSVGFARENHYLSASSAASHACYFRHALALDERRVKFLPEYFLEMNTQMDHKRSEYIVTSHGVEYVTSTSKRRPSAVSGDVLTLSEESVKEVWFAGSHSDVGGANGSCWSYNAGNVSLSWMRREAEASGLVLHPADTVWVPNDVDFGVNDSMTRVWGLVDYIPITYQVSFSGAGVNSLGLHRLKPRRIIPGQKIHASILYANTYKPRASLGEGFEIPIVHPGLDKNLDSRLWETGLFDAAAAQEIVACLSDQQGVAPIYLDRLLFMLRFPEGKQCVRDVPEWEERLLSLIRDDHCEPLVRLVIIVAYYEASRNPDTDLSPQILSSAKNCFSSILAAHEHQDLPRVISLLWPLTEHQVLQKHILTQDVLEIFTRLLDALIRQTGGNVCQAMGGLTRLLQCKDTQGFIIKKLGDNFPLSNVTRLSRLLEVKDSHFLTAVLRMVLALAQIPESKRMCLKVKPRLRELAKTDKRLVGVLSVEILLVICDANEQEPASIRNANARANVAGTLIRLDDSVAEEDRGIGPGLRHLFGADGVQLIDRQKMLIKKLKKDAQSRDARKRTAATLAVLKLCNTDVIRKYLLKIDLLDVFISQMRRKHSALLAAHALVSCLKYKDMKESIKNHKLLTNIVDMLRLDYFDDAVGQVEGFEIFECFMSHCDLRKSINDYNVIEVLKTKLVKGRPKDTRTGLICLDILCASDRGLFLHKKLVAESLACLQSQQRKTQNAGVAILCALAQTEHGVDTICPRVRDIIEMLLPPSKDSLALSSTERETSTGSTTSLGEVVEYTPMTQDSWSTCSEMMGLARVLHAFAQNETLRGAIHDTRQYGTLKCLHLSGAFMNKANAPPQRGNTLNPAVIDVLDKMIKVVDEAHQTTSKSEEKGGRASDR